MALEVNWINTEMSSEEAERMGLDSTNLLVIKADTHLNIMVYGYGAGNYKLVWWRGRNQAEPAGNDVPKSAGSEFWGIALVWASPLTIAHLVYEVVYGQ